MKIIGAPTSLQHTSSIGVSVRPQKSAAVGVAANSAVDVGVSLPSKVQSTAQSGGKPVRISRFPEEAALFAYNRHAQVAVEQPQAQIDEYV